MEADHHGLRTWDGTIGAGALTKTVSTVHHPEDDATSR